MRNVVVVGAGLAGLAAARRLVADGREVRVVEARERVGGRTEGLVLDDGTPLELGGQWLGEGHTRMHELVGELGLSTFRTWNDEGKLLLDLQGRRSVMKPRKGAVPRISPFALADLAQGLLRLGRLAARTDLERPWLTPGAEVLDGQTWESWIRRNLRTKAGRAYFHVACEAVWAAAAVLARSAHPADARRLGHQDLRHLPRTVLAPGRAQRAGRLRYRAGEGDLRQLTAVRHARRADGFPGGQPGGALARCGVSGYRSRSLTGNAWPVSGMSRGSSRSVMASRKSSP
jgi:monoamine oxidase